MQKSKHIPWRSVLRYLSIFLHTDTCPELYYEEILNELFTLDDRYYEYFDRVTDAPKMSYNRFAVESKLFLMREVRSVLLLLQAFQSN